MEYLDFELRVSPGTGRDYPVFVVRSPAGETGGTMHFPFDPLQLVNELRGIEIAVLRSGSLRRDVVLADPTGDPVARFGRQLFDALLPGSVLTALRRSQDRARAEKKGLRLRLRIETADLAAVPWEFMFDPDAGDYVCLSSATPVVRYIECASGEEVLAVEPPLRVLGVIASPVDRPALDVGREKRRLQEATDGLQKAGLLTLDWLEGSTPRDLQQALWKDSYHILHFVGHGGFDAAQDEGVLAFQNEDGKTAMLSATELGRLLADHRSLRLVVLNACLGAKSSSTAIFSSTASVLVRRHVPAVVAMQSEISDQAALEFSRSLYAAIAHDKPVDEAVTEARKAMSLSAQHSVEWGTPVLHMRSPDGVLFRIKNVPRPVTSVPPAPPLSETGRRNRRIVLDDVKSETTGRLAQMLEDGASLTIECESQPHQVTRPWDGDVKVGHLRSSSGRMRGSVLDVFDAESTAGKLLILGAPGAGKTGALLRLAQSLVSRAEANPAEPLPVLINLSSWTDDKRTFTDWLVGELKAKYGIQPNLGRSLIGERRLALLLDGLDELPGARQEPAVLAVNRFHRERRPLRLVVCCRTAEYESYSVKLELGGAIQLMPLSDSQIREYLHGVSAADIWESLATDPRLMNVARSPLFLRMLTLARDQISPEGWERLKASGERLAFLFDAYLRHLMARPVAKNKYSHDRTLAWLARLAAALKNEGAEEFLLERMQPTWLQSRGQLWSYRAVLTLTSAAVFGLGVLGALPTDIVHGGVMTRALEMDPNLHTPEVTVFLLAFLSVTALGVGVAVGAQRLIKPIETLRWSTIGLRDGLRRWPLEGWKRGLSWSLPLSFLLGAVLFLSDSFTAAGTFARWAAAGRTIGTLIAGLVLVALAGLVRGGEIDRLRHGFSPRIADAVVVGLAYWASMWLFIGGSVGMLMVVPAVCLAFLIAASPWLDAWLAERVAWCLVIGFVGSLGVMPLMTSPSGLWLDWLRAWVAEGIGFSATMSLLALMAARLARRRGSWLADPQFGLGFLPPLARTWGLRLLSGLLIALGLRIASTLMAQAGLTRLVRGGMMFELNVTTSLSAVLGTGVAGGIGGGVMGAFIGALLGLLRGFTGPEVQRRRVPNQGIRQSARNIGVCFLIGASLIGVPYGVASLGTLWLTTGVSPDIADMVAVVGRCAALMGLLGGLVPGAACLQHFTLRFILWCQGAMPWQCVHFLDHATERMLLQRIGGRYRFIHVLLRDHLAAKA